MLDEEEALLSTNSNRDLLGRFVKNHVPLNKTSLAIKCDCCGKTFGRIPTRFGFSNYCSRRCYKEHMRSKTTKVKCEACGKKFATRPARLKIGRGKYCSKQCYREALKGHKPWNKDKSLEEVFGKEKALKIKAQLATKTKGYWKKPGFVKKQMRARGTRPNHQEEFISKCFPFLQYVGDGTLIIGGKCPDFKVKDQHKLVEFFGDYWHDTSEEIQRISYFKRLGWDCLVIWDSELKNDFAMVADKLNEFGGQLN